MSTDVGTLTAPAVGTIVGRSPARPEDASAVAQLILLEREGRDRGWFEQEESTFHPDSLVRIAWFVGTGAEFVARSRAVFAAGLRPVHRMGPPVVHLDGDRAVAEAPAQISIIQDFDGIEGYVVNDVRLLYRAERRAGMWKLSQMDCIYERDTVVPAVVGLSPVIDPEVLDRFRTPYRYLAYHLHLTGKQARDDLFADDRRQEVDGLYAEAFAWLLESPQAASSESSTEATRPESVLARSERTP